MGSFTVSCLDAVLTTQSCLTLSEQGGKRYTNNRIIEPFLPNQNATKWRSSHSLMGAIQGSFTFVDDAILSSFRSANQYYVGSECLINVFEGEYSSRGAVLAAGKRLVSWRIDLTRER